MKLQSFRELIVWQKALKLAIEIYRVSKSFPREELYGLTSQIRRAAFSIPANIAEGYARRNLGEYLQFLGIAFGSGAELETGLIMAKEIQILSLKDFEKLTLLLDEVMKMLNALMKSLQKTKT